MMNKAHKKKSNKKEIEIEKCIAQAEKKDLLLGNIHNCVKKIEKKYDSNVICLFGDFTDYMYYKFVQKLQILERKKNRKRVKVTLVLHSLGGDADVATKIINVMNNYKHKFEFVAIVPILAMSAAAEVAISADKLILGKYAYLSAFDTYIEGISLKNIQNFKGNPRKLKDYNILMESVYNNSEDGVAYNQLLSTFGNRYDEHVINRIRDLFLEQLRTHQHPVTIDEIRSTGVTHVKQKKIKKCVYDLVYIYIDGTYIDEFRYDFYNCIVNKKG